MPKRLFKVPFIFSLKGVALVQADDEDEAHDVAVEQICFDKLALDDSTVFWNEEDGAIVLDADVAPGDPIIGGRFRPIVEVTDEKEVKDLREAWGIEEDEDADESDETTSSRG